MMRKFIKSKDVKISLVFSLIGLLAGLFMGMLQIKTLSNEMRETIISQLGSVQLLIPLSAIQVAFMSFILSLIGLKLAYRTNLNLNFNYNSKSFLLAAIIGLLLSISIIFSDKYIFAQFLPNELVQNYEFSILYFLSSTLYGGIVEELMLRLFFMSLIVFVLKKITRAEDIISSWIYVLSIIISAIVFAAAHLPATSQMLGLSAPIVIRNFVLNGLGGLGFGYLYWKQGLSYAMVAHVLAHMFNQFIFMPIMF